MNAEENARRINELNRTHREFRRTVEQRFEKLAIERPQAICDALADFEDEARRRGFRATPSLEYFAEKVSKRRLTPKKCGRPREDAVHNRVVELRIEGKSWPEIKRALYAETGVTRVASAYRNLLTKPDQERIAQAKRQLTR